ncbi:MAG: DMT family transporter [Thermoanaerobaculia bacterium]|nr:DMT family transporter [Thermoanaerobaculia bacterium]
MTARTLGLTATALVAFAANSWLCRAALRAGAIDAASFTAVRLATGAAVLWLLVRARRRPAAPPTPAAGSWLSAAALAAYALAFSFAYLGLDAGTGALILFPAVQLTMLAGGLLAGERPSWGEGLGVAVALAGLVVLGAPGASAPPPWAGAGMTAAGVAWGIYSLRGRGVERPLAATAENFVRTVPVAVATLAVGALAGVVAASPRGVALAALSGGVTSGLGYAVWYAALPGLRPLVAGLAQLAVPVLAAAGGVVLLGEALTPRLLAAGALILGGLALALRARGRLAPPRP